MIRRIASREFRRHGLPVIIQGALASVLLSVSTSMNSAQAEVREYYQVCRSVTATALSSDGHRLRELFSVKYKGELRPLGEEAFELVMDYESEGELHKEFSGGFTLRYALKNNLLTPEAELMFGVNPPPVLGIELIRPERVDTAVETFPDVGCEVAIVWSRFGSDDAVVAEGIGTVHCKGVGPGGFCKIREVRKGGSVVSTEALVYFVVNEDGQSDDLSIRSLTGHLLSESGETRVLLEVRTNVSER